MPCLCPPAFFHSELEQECEERGHTNDGDDAGEMGGGTIEVCFRFGPDSDGYEVIETLGDGEDRAAEDIHSSQQEHDISDLADAEELRPAQTTKVPAMMARLVLETCN